MELQQVLEYTFRMKGASKYEEKSSSYGPFDNFDQLLHIIKGDQWCLSNILGQPFCFNAIKLLQG